MYGNSTGVEKSAPPGQLIHAQAAPANGAPLIFHNCGGIAGRLPGPRGAQRL
jgi:hypothetical protein